MVALGKESECREGAQSQRKRHSLDTHAANNTAGKFTHRKALAVFDTAKNTASVAATRGSQVFDTRKVS